MKNPCLYHAGIRTQRIRFGTNKYTVVRARDIIQILKRRGMIRAVVPCGMMTFAWHGDMMIDATEAEGMLKGAKTMKQRLKGVAA